MESVIPALIIWIVSNSIFNKCCSGGVTHSVDNLSNHSVINMSVEPDFRLSQIVFLINVAVVVSPTV